MVIAIFAMFMNGFCWSDIRYLQKYTVLQSDTRLFHMSIFSLLSAVIL